MSQSACDATCIDLDSDTEAADDRPSKRQRNAFAVLFAAQRQPFTERPNPALSELPVSKLEAHEHTTLPGQYLILDFVTEEEEHDLLAFLDSDECGSNPWADSTFNGRHLSKRWGVRTDLKTNQFLPAERPMPSIFSRFLDRVRSLELLPGISESSFASSHALRSKQKKRCSSDVRQRIRDFRPNEANAIAYHRQLGHSLRNHCDHRSLSGDILVNLSLAGSSTMTYCPAHNARGGRGLKGAQDSAQRVELPRRSLQIQAGTVRYEYTHGIRLEDLPEQGRRVSITFRHNVSGFGHYDTSNSTDHMKTPCSEEARELLEAKTIANTHNWSLVASARVIELD